MLKKKIIKIIIAFHDTTELHRRFFLTKSRAHKKPNTYSKE